MNRLPDFDFYLDDNLAVYNAALEHKNRKNACEEISRRREARKRARIAARRRVRRSVALFAAAVLVLATGLGACAIANGKPEDVKNAAPAVTNTAETLELCTTPPTVVVVPKEPPAATEAMDFDAMITAYLANPAGEAEIEEALLAHAYLSTAVPFPYDLQAHMRVYCEKYGCPYPLALAVAEVESDFNMEAIGIFGEVGFMQLNPGPGGTYHAEIEAATGLDPTTPAGNIAGGCYKLGKYMALFDGDANKTAMAYNMGLGGAKEAWKNGVGSTSYSTAVVEAMGRWETTVNAWRGN